MNFISVKYWIRYSRDSSRIEVIIFLETRGSQILFDLFRVCIGDGVQNCGWGLGEGSNLQLDGLRIEIRGFHA